MAQETSRDQVGLVVPAFIADGPVGESVAYLIKLSVQGELSSEDPVTKKRGYGRGISYFVPAAMRTHSHEEAARLARLNGLQGTVWGYATELPDGVAIQSFLSLNSTYEDFRVTRNELWQWEGRGATLVLGPPQQNVGFRSETLTNDLVKAFGSPSDLDFCPIDGGACVQFDDYQVARAFGRTDTGAIVRRGGVDYFLDFPDSGLARSEVIDYAGIFIAYARGNLNQVIQFADRYLERHGPSDAAIDVHLYRAAARARLGQVEAARGDIDAALELNPVSRRSLRYGIMVELAAVGKPNERSESYFQMLARTYGLSSEFDRRYASLDR
ncbi:hypothetical protein DOO74_20830 [Rhodobacteraceae bacterium AsT-22]|nr:hypothetical protein DOO74_20830 [Rhodobacteraceae bacterium AsT-22]